MFLALHPDARMEMIDVKGGAAPPKLVGPKLMPDVPTASFRTGKRCFLAASSDGKYAYFSGLAPKRSWSSEKTPPYPAVFRVKLPERLPNVSSAT